MSDTKEIANYDEELAALAKEATKIEKPSTSNIGVRAGVITYNGDPVPGNKLDVIVLSSIHQNLYYEGKWDPQNPTNPVCFAYSSDGENMAPHPASSKPQSETCFNCPLNQWKSDPDGGKGKACKNSRKLAVIPAGTEPADLATVEIATLALPVTSVKSWAQYVNKCATLYSRPPLGLVTTIGSVPDVKTQFKITFQNGPLLDNSMLGGLIHKSNNLGDLLERVYEPNPEPTAEDEAKAAKSAARGKKF